MATTENAQGNGLNGLNQERIANMLNDILAGLYVLANKLDGDGGVTATDFTADMEKIVASGAQMVGATDISTAVQAAIA